MDLYIKQVDSYDIDLLNKCVAEIFEQFNIGAKLYPNAKVLLKVNLLRDLPPERAGTTHPMLVQAVASRLIKDYNCKVVIGDSSGGVFTLGYMNTVYRVTGMSQAAENSGAELNYNFGSSRVIIDGNSLKSVEIIDAFIEADVVINLAKFKTHSFAGFTGAVKNMFGLIPGLIKVEMHSRFTSVSKFTEHLIDISQYSSTKTVLNIVDGIIGMEGDGPANGTPKFIGKIFASDNAYLVDIACISAFTNPLTIPVITKAIEFKLISEEMLSHPKVIEMSNDKIIDFVPAKFANVSSFIDNLPEWLSKFVSNGLTNKATIIKNKCKGCGKCRDHCPKKAININNKIAHIKQSKCIRCYCCQELCPFDSVKLSRSFVGKIFYKLSNKKKK